MTTLMTQILKTAGRALSGLRSVETIMKSLTNNVNDLRALQASNNSKADALEAQSSDLRTEAARAGRVAKNIEEFLK